MSSLKNAVVSLLLIGFVGIAPANAQTYPITIDTFSFNSDIRVSLTKYSFNADETWSIAGSCEGAMNASRIKFEQYSFNSDIKVSFTKYSFNADRTVCITNPNAIPDWVWEYLE